MKRVLILIFITSCIVFSQSLAPTPTFEGTRFSFKSDYNFKVNTVNLAGSFNNWNRKADYMKYDEKTGIWSISLKLTKGVEYSYKFVINDSMWIADPNALSDKTDVTNNSVVIPQEFGKPYVSDIYPALFQRVKKLPIITMKLNKVDAEINTSNIITKIDGQNVPNKYDAKTGVLNIMPQSSIKDGDKKVYIEFSDKKGLSNGGYETFFYLDRFINDIKTPKFYDKAILYEAFIRSFKDSDGDGVGDFKGLTSKLDYLQNLGINAIWLMPFNESSRPHGYNVVDYFAIEKDYGTMADYKEFVKEAKKRGIKIIMDFVINHTDSTCSLFLDACRNPKSKYSKWYKFTDEKNEHWEHFGAERSMPKLNFDEKELQDYVIKIAKFWMDPNGDGKFDDGVDGFRCDAAREVPHFFWKRFRSEIKKANNETLLLAEIWDGAAMIVPFFKEEFDMCFAFPVKGALGAYLNGNNIDEFVKRAKEESELYPAGYQMCRFLANHDVSRALSSVNDNVEKYKMLSFMNVTLYGTPMIYYGDEIGMKGIVPSDENARKRMEWDEVEKQENDPASLLNFNKTLLKLRKDNPTLAERNDSKITSIDFGKNSDKVLGYLRYDKKNNYIVICNNTAKQFNALDFEFTKSVNIGKNPTILYSYKAEKGEMKVAAKKQKLNISGINIAPQGFVLIKLK